MPGNLLCVPTIAYRKRRRIAGTATSESPAMNTRDAQFAVVSPLLHIQQALLLSGYHYVSLDPERWPLCDVEMEKEGRVLLIARWKRAHLPYLREAWRYLLSERHDAGLLLVGLEAVTSDELADFVQSVPGTVGYVDVQARQYRVREDFTYAGLAPEILSDDGLAELFSPTMLRLARDVDLQQAIQQLYPHFTVRKEQLAPLSVDPLPIERVRWPIFTVSTIVLCAGMYLLSLAVSGRFDILSHPEDQALITLGALVGDLVRQGEWWRFITVALLHGSVIHLGMNMLALYIFGSQLERWQGHWRLGAGFIASVITGSVASFAWNHDVFSVGASGGVFGLLGYMGALLLRYRKSFPPNMRKELGNWLRSILIYNILFSFLPGIDFAAHFGGLLGGFLLGLLISVSPFSAPGRRAGRAPAVRRGSRS